MKPRDLPVRSLVALSAGTVLAVDQLSKLVASSGWLANWLLSGGSVASWFRGRIASRGNSDFLFGIDLGLPLWLAGLSIVLAAGMWSLFVWRSAPGISALVAVTLLVPSVTSNLLDRVVFGHVRDWICIGPTLWNVADFGIALGLIVGLGVVTLSTLSDEAVKGG